MNNAPPPTLNTSWPALLIAACALLAVACSIRIELLGPLFHLRGWIAGLLPLLAFWETASRAISLVQPNGDALERTVFTAFLALAIASLIGFLLLTFNIGNPTVFLSVAGIAVILERRAWAQRFTEWIQSCQTLGLAFHPLWLAVAAFIALFAIAASLPPLWYDTHEYHLYAPEQYLRAGGWFPFSHNVYCAFPMNVEMLYLWPLAAGSSVGCKVVLFVFALIAAAATVALAKRWGIHTNALWSALVLFATGLLLRVVMQGKIDAALVASTAVLLLAYERYRTEANPLDGAMVAAAVGFSLGAKYVAALSIAAPFVMVVLIDAAASKQWRRMSVFLWCIAGGLVWCAPWLVRNWVYYDNPVYPLLTPLLGGSPPLFAELFQAAHAPASSPLTEQARDFVWLPLQKSLFESIPIGFSPLWLAALPLLVARPQNSGASRGAVFCLVAYIGWFVLTQRNDRFLAPLLPLLAIMPVVVIERCRACNTQRALVVLISLFLALQLWLGGRVVVNSQSVDYITSPSLEESYLGERMPHYRAIDWLNRLKQELPEQVGNVVFVGEAQAYGARFAAVAPTVFNRHPLESNTLHNVSHILYNRSELSRLAKGYGPLGWTLGPLLQQRMDELTQSAALEEVYRDPDYPDVIKVFRVK